MTVLCVTTSDVVYWILVGVFWASAVLAVVGLTVRLLRLPRR